MTTSRGRRGARLTGKVFTDLAIWMIGLGLLTGAVFPFAIIPLGVPARYTLKPAFFVATLAAGLMVGGLNHLLARGVIGTRLRLLAERMRHVGEVIGEMAYSGDYSRCSPEECALEVDSDDELGDAARSFNLLIAAVADSYSVASSMGGFTATMANHLELDALSGAALPELVAIAGAEAGALVVVRDGDLVVETSLRMTAGGLTASAALRQALDTQAVTVIDVPDGVKVDATLVEFRPARVAVLPLHLQGVLVGGVVLAFARAPEPDALRLVDSLRGSTSVALHNALTHERFQRLAAVDPLTGAYNRRFGLGRLGEEFARAVRSTAPLGVVAFDLDHFKAINDTYGHLVGDQVLRDVVAAASRVLREGDVLVRTGGEEFVAILPGAGVEDIARVGERLRRAVAALVIPTAMGDVRVTISLGGAAFPDRRIDAAEDLLDLADQALYSAKEAGRDRLTVSGRVPVAG